MGVNRRNIRSICLGGTAMVGALALLAAPAQAQEQRFELDVPSQRLDTALRTFARQSQQQLIYAVSETKGFNAPALNGSYTADEAIEALLAGTSLEVHRTGSGVFLIGTDDPQGGSAAGNAVQALIVTAQKREEDIQDVPIAISAFSQEDLTRSQVAGGPDLITQVPNMTFTKTNFSSYSIQLRGIGTQAISATTDPGVAVAFNNTPFIRNRFFEQEFYDLERVEVLRGPQGTLYGRNATAGVVNIISAKPKFYAEAKASADVANYSSSRIEGMVNIPLVEHVVALRLAGAWTKRNGFVTNEITGSPIDGRDLWSTRLSLRISPTDRIDANLIWEHFEEDDDRLRSGKQLCKKDVVTEVGGVPITSFEQGLVLNNLGGPWVAVQPRLSQGCERESLYSDASFETPNGASVPYYLPLAGIGLPYSFFDPYANQTQSRDLRVIESTFDPEYRAKSDLGELQISIDITDSLTLASETAYSTDFVYSLQDFNRFNTKPGAFCEFQRFSAQACSDAEENGQPFSSDVEKGLLDEEGVFCDPQLGCSDRLIAVDLSTAKSRNFSQEFRLSSDFDGSFNFSLGANFLRYDTEDKYYVFINTLTLTTLSQFTSSTTLSHPYVPGASNNRECLLDGASIGDPTHVYGFQCVYVETNSIENLEDQGHNYFLSKNPYKLISYAAFGEAYYNITDNLKVTAGLRWTVDKKEAPRIPSWTLANDSRGYPVLEVINQEWREPTGRLTIDWKPDFAFTDETLLYASYSHGYKGGGANPPPMLAVGVDATNFGGTPPSATRPKTFDPEFIDAFELGAKNTLLDGSVTLNLAAFYYDYTGYQISEIVDRSAFNRNFDAEVWGLEIEADWRPLENLRLGFKGGYENTRIRDGEQAIDLMDRTAGNPDWVIVRPFPTFASSCILPTAMFTHTGTLPQAPGEPGIELPDGLHTFGRAYGSIYDLGGGGGSASGGCEYAYFAGHDPVTNLPYDDYPTSSGSSSQLAKWPTGTYPGWNPEWAPNNGEGFYKHLGGNELPNAPNFTATITADYTLPLPNEWLMTLHTDLYWQSEAWWRVFNDHEYNKLDEYFTMNLAAIFANDEAGWRVMAYVKNVFDRDSITGAFLNSDDTALTTNVFLTEPRLYGIRVTKAWEGGPLLGSFGERRDGPYPFTIELGGQVQRHDASSETLTPSFIDEFSDHLNLMGDQQENLDWGDGREVKLTYRADNGWKVSAEARFGKTNGSAPWNGRTEIGDSACLLGSAFCDLYPSYYYSRLNYSNSIVTEREEHTIVDFMVGMDAGFGGLEESSLSAGVRYADLASTSRSNFFGVPNVEFNATEYAYFDQGWTHDRFVSDIATQRDFQGAGPVVSWEASARLFGSREVGTLGFDWSLTGGVLFGDRETIVLGEEFSENYIYSQLAVKNEDLGYPDGTTLLPGIDLTRSESVTVPMLGGSLGLSYRVDRFSIGAGYRWERYVDAIDGGFMDAKDEDRTIDGPYFKIAIGFGG